MKQHEPKKSRQTLGTRLTWTIPARALFQLALHVQYLRRFYLHHNHLIVIRETKERLKGKSKFLRMTSCWPSSV